jgi:hypothetical protein
MSYSYRRRLIQGIRLEPLTPGGSGGVVLQTTYNLLILLATYDHSFAAKPRKFLREIQRCALLWLCYFHYPARAEAAALKLRHYLGVGSAG